MRILYIIDWAAISGGAEAVVLNTISGLPGEKHLAYFWRYTGFEECNYPGVTFWHIKKGGSWSTMRSAVREVKKIIRDYDIQIVYSHLFWSNNLARLAVPPHVRLFTCIHNIETRASLRKGYLQLMENLLYRNSEVTFCVSDEVNKDYRSIVKHANTITLYNCIADQYFNAPKIYVPFNKPYCRLIAIGNTKPQKNYEYVLRVFSELKQQGINHIELDVYGDGVPDLYQQLDGMMKPNVHFRGLSLNIRERMDDYDAFILPSTFEGFGLTTLEAMASRLPVFLSDIPVNREVSGGHAVFFDLNRPADAAEKLKEFASGRMDLTETVERAYQQALAIAQRKDHVKKLIEYFS
jgi:glycosyltransferase involved in cell wall biosynthesis